MSDRDEIAEVLAEHVYAAGSDGRGCLCGWRRHSGDERPLQEQHATIHLAAVLAERERRVKAEALREVADALERRAGQFRHLPGDRHTRRAHNDIARWLRDRARADRIEGQ